MRETLFVWLVNAKLEHFLTIIYNALCNLITIYRKWGEDRNVMTFDNLSFYPVWLCSCRLVIFFFCLLPTSVYGDNCVDTEWLCVYVMTTWSPPFKVNIFSVSIIIVDCTVVCSVVVVVGAGLDLHMTSNRLSENKVDCLFREHSELYSVSSHMLPCFVVQSVVCLSTCLSVDWSLSKCKMFTK